MQTQIINGRKIRDEILEKVKREVATLPFVPVFCDILVGSDPSSVQYVRMKANTAYACGMKFRQADFKEDITTEELIEEIKNLNHVPHICGVIVQLPLPSHFDKERILDEISPVIDVDCLSKTATENFYNNKTDLIYPTAKAVITILDSIVDLKDKNILVLGQGRLVGKPVTHLLKERGLEVATTNSKTENINDLVKNADIIISAMGQGKFIKGDMIKEGAVIIDAGTSEENGSIVGDVDTDSVVGIASYLTPTPGGVGPVTIAMLLENVLQVAKNKK